MAEETVNYFDPKVLSGLKRLDVRARMVMEGYLTGLHKSPFSGFAVEFAEHREYAPGDDTKHIDWKLWSKTDRLYIKEYEEETNLRCTLLIDASKSMAYPTKRGLRSGDAVGLSKYDYACTAASALAHLLNRQQDATGLVVFSDQVDTQLKPAASPNHLKRIIHELQSRKPERSTDFDGVFPELAARLPKRGLIVLFSDLFLSDFDQLEKAMEEFRLRRHEVVVFHVMHEDELTFPFEDQTKFEGMEVSEEIQADPRALRNAYLKVVEEYLAKVQKLCSNQGVDYVMVNTADPLDATLNQYFSFRQRTKSSRR